MSRKPLKFRSREEQKAAFSHMPKSSLMKIHENRPEQDRYIDDAKNAKNLIQAGSDETHKWVDKPNRFDVAGVDYFGKTPKNKKESKTHPSHDNTAKEWHFNNKYESYIIQKEHKSFYGKDDKRNTYRYLAYQIDLDGEKGYAGEFDSEQIAKKAVKGFIEDRKTSIQKDIVERQELTKKNLKDYIAWHDNNLHWYELTIKEHNAGTRIKPDYVIESTQNNIKKEKQKIEKAKNCLDRYWDKTYKLNIVGNKKLKQDIIYSLKHDFAIKDAKELVSPNLKVEYSKNRGFAGRFISSKDGIPTVQISSNSLKGKNIIDDRYYRGTIIHELIHYIRYLHRDKIGRGWAYEKCRESESEEKATVMETQQRGGPGYTSKSDSSYYQFIKDAPYNVGNIDNKRLTDSDIVKKEIRNAKVSNNILKRGDKTYISRLRYDYGREKWIDRELYSSEGDYMHTYNPSAKKPNINEDIKVLDSADEEIGEEEIIKPKYVK